MEATIINFCPTGMVPVKSQNPFVPTSPAEIIEQVHQAYEIGITIAHLHARDDHEQPTYRKNIYSEIFEGVRKHCPDLVICGSSSGRTYNEFEKRSAVIELQPDMCSLTLSSLNFNEQASVNSPDMIIRLAEKMNEYGVKQELECFDMGMINYGKYLIRKGILQGPFYWNLIFGNIAGFQSSLAHIGTATTEIGENENFIAFGGLGKHQLVANSIAIASGFGVRIGLEDSLWMDAGKKDIASNMALLKRVHLLMKMHNKKLFKPSSFGKLGFYNAHTLARI